MKWFLEIVFTHSSAAIHTIYFPPTEKGVPSQIVKDLWMPFIDSQSIKGNAQAGIDYKNRIYDQIGS
ncbi:hypothetical protein [Paenibacillus antarcticus]|uniref:Uncharacterized protein n=1 Tax=Paenibacillus antarcticus TaxID=253703 RepID=A0A168LU57_9BACL|nr:hypothetical protein [Paenibacillus antarcticus]OAB43838.1 hypothetical protein PBAT_16560 [Paenibacillus antarcticus]